MAVKRLADDSRWLYLLVVSMEADDFEEKAAFQGWPTAAPGNSAANESL